MLSATPVGRETPDTGNKAPTIDSKSNPIEKVIQAITKAIVHTKRINEQLLRLNTDSRFEKKMEVYTKILNNVNNTIGVLDSIDISQLPKSKVSGDWASILETPGNGPDYRQPPPPTDYEFVEYSEPYEAANIINIRVQNFIWFNSVSNEFTPDEIPNKIRKLSTLKKLYSSLKTFLEEKINLTHR